MSFCPGPLIQTFLILKRDKRICMSLPGRHFFYLLERPQRFACIIVFSRNFEKFAIESYWNSPKKVNLLLKCLFPFQFSSKNHIKPSNAMLQSVFLLPNKILNKNKRKAAKKIRVESRAPNKKSCSFQLVFSTY